MCGGARLQHIFVQHSTYAVAWHHHTSAQGSGVTVVMPHRNTVNEAAPFDQFQAYGAQPLISTTKCCTSSSIHRLQPGLPYVHGTCSSDSLWMVYGSGLRMSLLCEMMRAITSMSWRFMSMYLRTWRVCLGSSLQPLRHPGV